MPSMCCGLREELAEGTPVSFSLFLRARLGGPPLRQAAPIFILPHILVVLVADAFRALILGPSSPNAPLTASRQILDDPEPLLKMTCTVFECAFASNLTSAANGISLWC